MALSTSSGQILDSNPAPATPKTIELLRGEAAPFTGALVPQSTLSDLVGSKKKLTLCHEALDTCNKSVKFPDIVAPVRDGVILGFSAATIIAVIAYSLGGK